jgi:hypothetical protein
LHAFFLSLKSTMQLTRHLDANATLVSLIEPLAHATVQPDRAAGVQVLRASCDVARGPQIYEPSLMIMAQGSKLAFLGPRTLEYGAGHYLIQALPVPFECETFAMPDAPLLGCRWPSTGCAGRAGAGHGAGAGAHSGADPESMTSVVLDDACAAVSNACCAACTIRWSARFGTGAGARIVVHRAARAAGRCVARTGGTAGAIRPGRGVDHHLHAHYAEPLNVETLASCANMSVSTFHEHFKRSTLLSPVQYLKRLRLLKAQPCWWRRAGRGAGGASGGLSEHVAVQSRVQALLRAQPGRRTAWPGVCAGSLD